MGTSLSAPSRFFNRMYGKNMEREISDESNTYGVPRTENKGKSPKTLVYYFHACPKCSLICLCLINEFENVVISSINHKIEYSG